MAQKLEASLALEGQFSVEGLAAMSADSGSLTMELARSLVENLDFGDSDRVWEQMGIEQPQLRGESLNRDGEISTKLSDVLEYLESMPGQLRDRNHHIATDIRVVRQLDLFPDFCGNGDDLGVSPVNALSNSRRLRRNRCRR